MIKKCDYTDGYLICIFKNRTFLTRHNFAGDSHELFRVDPPTANIGLHGWVRGYYEAIKTHMPESDITERAMDSRP